MSKITFRADDDLVTRLEERGESKSEIMREALRTYLDGDGEAVEQSAGAPDVIGDRVEEVVDGRIDSVIDARIDAALDARIDAAVADRLDAALADRRGQQPAYTPESGRDVNVNVSLDGLAATDEESTASVTDPAGRAGTDTAEPVTERADRTASCDDCGERMPDDHVYCPNCGEKRTHRVYCECGDELRSDWSFCPGCGRRTPAADVLDTR